MVITSEDEKNIQTVSFEQFEKVYKKLKQTKVKEIGLDFILASLFPTLSMNFKQICDKYYTQGYVEGLKENENKGNN